MIQAKRFTWREFWALSRPYWFSDERWSARGLLALIVGLNLGQVYLSVVFNEWNNLFYNALQEYNQPEYFHQLLRFCVIAAIYIVTLVYAFYLNQMLQIRWRRWLTEHYLQRWLAHRAYYHLQLEGFGTDNPDQRISEDLAQFVQFTLDIGLGLLNSAVTLVSFLTILWALSGALSFTVFGTTIDIPGYMLWAALVYAVAGTWLTHVIGRPLIGLNFNQQRFEADFRFAMVRLRENAEAVALYGGEEREHDGFTRRFAFVFQNWWALMGRQKTVYWLRYGYQQVAVVFPFVVAAPRYFGKTIQLGGLMQIASAFGQVQSSLSFFVDSYTAIARWRAVVERLITFERAVREANLVGQGSAIALQSSADASLHVSTLELQLPNGAPLVAEAAMDVAAGETVLISGPSGSGKSTLFRALAGIWPFGRGVVKVPKDAKVMFLPQKPYMPLGTLGEALSYPEPAAQSSEADKRRALADCGLEHLAERLDEEQNWGQVLSPGEQQRVAFARVLLKRPDWVFLDEATAALDEPLEQALYAKLHERLPRITVVSIGHRPGVAQYHGRRLALHPASGGARLDPVSAAAVL
ncbi:MAG TPA: ABC transporter ATP-binding protein/permease [Candidatus Cybelea sp.]|nr:ABC transporter ATP-binding protein/permease [Candidatus Cybelea sp.]